MPKLVAAPQASPENSRQADKSDSSQVAGKVRREKTEPKPEEASQENKLGLQTIKNIVRDQRQIWTSPAHIRLGHADWLAPYAGLTAGFLVTDRDASLHLSNSPSTLQHYRDLSNYGLAGMGGAVGGLYLWGKATNDPQKEETGILVGEAAVNALLVTEVMKYSFGRERPTVDGSHGKFWQGGDSFPSGHAAISWAAASVISHEYPGFFTKILAYGAASAISISRIEGKRHFPSDALVGSGIGWFAGWQAYRTHHNRELDGGTLEDLSDSPQIATDRTPSAMGSPYVPLDSWIYPLLDRLAALGLFDDAILGMKPWTRLECARMLEEAQQKIADEDDELGQAATIYGDLASEFSSETGRLNGAANVGASIDTIYMRATNISGQALRDGYHFGQTIINDYGRPYGEWFNSVDGVTAHAEAGPLAFFVRGEYQHAPAVPSDPITVLQAIATADVTLPLANGRPQIDRFRLLEGTVGVTFSNIQLSFGKQSLWLGTGESGPFLFSTNAEPVTMLRADNVSPVRVPLLSRVLGPMRMDFSIAQLSGHHWDFNPPNLLGPDLKPQPFLHENKISFKPSSNLEFGVGVTAIFGGPGLPFTWSEFLRSYYSHKASVQNGNPAKRFSGFDFSYRVPGLRNWLTIYNDSLVVDEISPIGSTRPLLNPGLYFPQFPKIPKLELRVEGEKSGGLPHHFSNGFDYWDARFRSGYTNNGNLIGASIRDGIAGQAWAKYSFSTRSSLQFGYRHAEVDRHFVGGGRLNDFSGRTELMLGPKLAISCSLQYEQWNFPVLRSTPQSDVSAQVQLTFFPKWKWHTNTR